MTRVISPLALTAPVAALAVVAATGWAISADDQPVAAVAVPATSAAPVSTKDPALHALRKAVLAERADVRHLEKAVNTARKRLESARQSAVIAAAATPSTSYGGTSTTVGTSATSGSSGSSGGSTNSGSPGGSSGGTGAKPAPKPAPAPSANTSTGGS